MVWVGIDKAYIYILSRTNQKHKLYTQDCTFLMLYFFSRQITPAPELDTQARPRKRAGI